MTRLLRLLCVALLATALSAPSAAAQYNNCLPPTGRGEPVRDPEALRGTMMLVAYATSGPRAGRIAAGTLDLQPASAAMRQNGVLMVGSSTLEFSTIGARVTGSPRSRDPGAPGVTLQHEGGGRAPMSLTFGSVRTRRSNGEGSLPSTRFQLVEQSRKGYRGTWRSSGPGGEVVGGYFCASRF